MTVGDKRAATLLQQDARDAELAGRFRAGDESAFEEIMDCYRARVFSISLAIVRSRKKAAEVTRETFARAHRGLPRFIRGSSLATWLYRIAVRLSRSRYRRLLRWRPLLSFACAPGGEWVQANGDPFPPDDPRRAAKAPSGELTPLVAACIEKLEPLQCEVLMLRAILDRSYDEIAQALGLSASRAKQRLCRARANLRRLLVGAHPEFSPSAAPSDWLEDTRMPDPSGIGLR